LAASTGAINDQIFVVTEGLIAGLNTSTANAGDPVWLGTGGNLIFGLLNKPVAPAHLVYLGVVTRVQQNNGEIFVNVQNGFELHELHDVLISSPSTGQLIRRDSDGLWKNWTPNYLTSLPTHNHDDLYYTESEIAGFFGGEAPIAGYNATNWDTAYGWGNHADYGYLTSLPVHNHDDRYYTETESDSRFVNTSGDTMSGSLSFDQAAVIKKRITQNGFNPVKTSSGVLTSISDNSSGYTYYVIETNVPQDDYQMGGFTIELFGRYGETNNKTKIDLAGYWNPEGNSGFVGFEAHGTNPQYKPTIEVSRNSQGNTAFIIYGVSWSYPIIVARDLWLGYNSTDGGTYGEGWTIRGTNDVSSYTNKDTVVWRNAYSDSNPAGYITGYTETDTLATVTSRGSSTTSSITINGTASITTDIVLTRSDTTPALVFTNQNGLRWVYSGGGNYWSTSLSIDSNNLINMGGSPLATHSWVQAQGYATQTWVGLNYYNEGEIDDFFSGAEAISGYSKSNWDTAYNDRITSAAVTGTSTKTLTLTQQDGGTVTATWTDYDTDTDAQTLTWVAGTKTLEISGGNDVTLDGLATEEFVTGQGYITGYTESDTLATVTARGATTSGAIYINGDLNFTPADGIGINAKESMVFTIDSDNNDTGRIFQFREGSGNTLMVIQEAGNVGIGTTSPNYKLDVNGSINIYTGNSLRWGSGDVEILNSGYSMLFSTYTGSALTEKMRITSAGNVGIGTTSPVVKLQVDGTITSTGVLTAYTSVPSINIGHNGDSAFIAATSGGGADTPISFSVGNNNEKMRITAAGNVGIGTTSPASKLHISNATGNVTSEIQSVASGANAILKLTSPSNNWQIINDGTSANLDFQRGGSSQVYFKSDGNVGIGTTSPNEKLHVVGAAIFDGGAGDSSTDSVLYVTKSNSNDWGLYVNASGVDYGMYVRISPSAGYAFGIHNGTTWTTRITGDGRIHLNNKDTIASYDSWLRLNQSGEYTSGVYTPAGLRNDGTFENYGGIYGYNTIRGRKAQTNNNYTTAALWTESYDNTTTGIAFHISGNVGKFLEMRTDGVLYWENAKVWTAATDGSGSGLDADTVDGIHASTFATRQDGARYSTDVNSLMSSGFYNVEGQPANSPVSYGQIIVAKGIDTAFQIAGGYSNNALYFRGQGYGPESGGFYPWRRVWHNDDFSSTNISNWNAAYNDRITAVAVSGTGTKTLTLTQQDGGTLTATWTDYDTDNDAQTLSWDQGQTLLSISGGNDVTLTGLATEDYVNSQGFVTSSGTVAGVVRTVTGTNSAELVRGNMGDNDQARILVGATASNAGYLEIATADDGTEPIYVRQYTGVFSSLTRTATLLDGSGNTTFPGSLTIGGTFTENSSIRFKENIQPLEPALAKVEQLNPVTYTKITSQEEEIGLIAEEVAELFPEVVTYNENGQPQGIQYQRLSVILLKAVQELTERVNKLENK
jgi:hypothetical protein